MRAAFGTASVRISRRFALSSSDTSVMPVTLPPGRARLSIRPMPSALPTWASTIGIDEVAREPGKPILLGLGPPAQVDDVLRLDVAELLESLSQRQRGKTVRRPRASGQEPDPPRLAPRLRAGGDRRRGQAERDAGNKRAPIHHGHVRFVNASGIVTEDLMCHAPPPRTVAIFRQLSTLRNFICRFATAQARFGRRVAHA